MTEEEIRANGITREMAEECAEVIQRHVGEWIERYDGDVKEALVQVLSYSVEAGRALKLTREQFQAIVMRLWDARDALLELVQSGRAEGPEGFERCVRALRGERVLEVVE